MKKAESPKKSAAATAKTVAKAAAKTAAVKPAAKKAPAKTAAVKPAAKKAAAKPVAVKPAAKKAPAKTAAVKPAAKKAPAKTAAVKPAAKKAAAKPVAVKPATKKAAAKPVAVKPAAKKVFTVVVKPAAKKTAVRKSRVDENGEIIHHHKKLKLTKTKQKFYTELLMRERQKFLGQLEFHQDDALSSKKDSASERAGMATHMADLGTDNFRHEMELGLLSDEGDVLSMIDEALQRIKDSEYGICVECGCEINPARLASKPYARFCVRCKSAHEQLEDPIRRHR